MHYDSAGNFVEWSEGASRRRVIERKVTRNGFRVQVWRYQWDAKDRLIATITPDGERWTYAYDPFGRRIFKINAKAAQAALLAQSSEPTEEEKNRGAYYEERTRRGSHSEAAKSIVGTTYLWDGHVIAEEAPMLADGSADWDKATRWHYEPDSFRPIAKETASGELLYIVNDHLGTPREMFSEDGHLVWAAQYRTWGGLKKVWRAENDNDARGPYPPVNRGSLAVKYETVEALAAQDCPIRFQGQWEDAETGLYYNRYRYYDPLAGQYLSPDPIGLAGGLRSQGYVENPSAWIDPWGLAGKKCCAEFGNFRDHADRHGGAAGMTRKQYYDDAVRHIQKGEADWSGKYYHDGKFKMGYVSKIGNNSSGQALYSFTGTTLSGNRIFTHMPEGVTAKYLSNFGITLP